MARPAGGTVHVGKAAALIIAALLVGGIVLYHNSSGGSSLSAAEAAAAAAANAGANATTTTAATSHGATTTTVALRAPAQIKVIAINATQKAGQGALATTKLTNAGYNAVAPGNGTVAERASNPTSVIYVVTPGYENEAKVIAGLFGLPASAVRALPTPSPSTDIKPGINIAVLIGSGITLT
jgi:hypothetical protein